MMMVVVCVHYTWFDFYVITRMQHPFCFVALILSFHACKDQKKLLVNVHAGYRQLFNDVYIYIQYLQKSFDKGLILNLKRVRKRNS